MVTVMKNLLKCGFSFAITAMLAAWSFAGSPEVNNLSISGLQRGTSGEVVIAGARIGDANSLVFFTPGITARDITKIDANQIKATIDVSADVKPDLHPFRVVTDTGISNVRLFGVSDMPVVAEVEPNSEFATPQAIPVNSTVQGVVRGEDVDYFVVELKKGQTMQVELEGLRHSYMYNFFDPYIAIYDDKRFEIAASDDSVFLQQDCLAAITAPEDGKYIIEVRESSFGGNDACKYQLHVGSFRRPIAILPAGGPPGQPLTAKCVDILGNEWEETFTVSDQPQDAFPVWSQIDGLRSPSPNWIRVNGLNNVVEQEPNEDHNKIETVNTIPAAFNGVLQSKGDRDFFVFEAKKDQQIEVRVHARSPIRSQVDPVLQIWKVGGGALAGNDDSGGPDSYLSYKIPEDGKYAIHVYDHLGSHGKHFVYRAEVTLPTPTVVPSIVEQERYISQVVNVPRGSRMAVEVNVARQNLGGNTLIEAIGLPPGMTHAETICSADQAKVTMLFRGEEGATNAGKLVDFTATIAPSAEQKFVGRLAQRTQLVRGQNNVDVWGMTKDQLAVALINPAPFDIEVVQPQVPLVRDGSMALQVNIKRKEGFDKPVTVSMLGPPPGIGAATFAIPGDQSTGLMQLTANGGAPIREWPLVLMATTDIGYGPIQVASEFFKLDIKEQLFTFEFAKTMAEQGKPVDVIVGVKLKRPVEGQIELEILGVPPGTTATNAKQAIPADAERLAFKVEVPAETRAGNYKTIVFRGTVTSPQGVITQVNGNAEMQVDVPIVAVTPTPAPSPAAAAPPPTPTTKPLTRLEQLKQQRGK